MSNPSPDNRRQIQVTDPAAWRQLAHPTRRAIVFSLQHRDCARASDLADEVGAAPNAVSFHLRRLADHGFVEEAESPTGDAREKWWRSTAVNGFQADPTQLARVPGGTRAFQEVSDAVAAEAHEFVATWFAQATPTSPEPTGAERFRLNFDLRLDFTEDEFAQFRSELRDVLFRWSERTRTQDRGKRRSLRFLGFGLETPE